MKTVTLDVRSPADSMADFVQSWKTGTRQKTARTSFAARAAVAGADRKNAGNCSRHCAVPGRYPSAKPPAAPIARSVHGDVTALLNAGLLDRTEDGRIVFPCDAVKVEFLLQAAWRPDCRLAQPWPSAPASVAGEIVVACAKPPTKRIDSGTIANSEKSAKPNIGSLCGNRAR